MTDKLNDNDRQRIEQAGKKYQSRVHGENQNLFRYAFIEGAEYEHKYQREQQEKEIERLKGWQESAITVLNKWQLVSQFLADNNMVGLNDNYSEKCLEVLKQLEAERSELIRRIKSILKASTVHDKISIIEELEQLLNSLKTK